jgi:pantoate--beta-alanine ligase
MIVVRNTSGLREYINSVKKSGKRIGFVPTMGSLHEGHLSLIALSKKKSDFTVCSIFVNPTQFNDLKDLEKYPRNESRDIDLLNHAKCDLVYIPSVNDIYEAEPKFDLNLNVIDSKWEGVFRPGHFLGVARVVKILFEKVEPDFAFFGQKDFQQVLVVETLCDQLKLPVEIIRGEIIRESDGLAMSSRNTLLDKDERNAAAHIPKWLNRAEEAVKNEGSAGLEKLRIEINATKLFRLEYFVYCHRKNLNEMTQYAEGEGVLLFAAFCGKIRLIDNRLL